MNLPRSRAHVIVRSRDPRLRSLIAERLAAQGDLIVEMGSVNDEEIAIRAPTNGARLNGVRLNGAAVDAAAGPDAVVEVQEPEAGITPREAEVLGLMAEGLANKEIAARLAFSSHTAKFHVESLLRKLDAANRAEAVREGIRRGLIGV
jgi:DNA-binding CsgD family transcriptional regulator